MTDKMPTIVVVDDSVTSISLYEFSILLFLDIIMPGMDGLSLLRHLRTLAHQKDTRVIMVTSKDYAQDRQVAKQLGTEAFLVKPLKFKEIREIVCKYVDVKPKSTQ